MLAQSRISAARMATNRGCIENPHCFNQIRLIVRGWVAPCQGEKGHILPVPATGMWRAGAVFRGCCEESTVRVADRGMPELDTSKPQFDGTVRDRRHSFRNA